MVSCMFVVVSTLCLIFSTLPRFQQKDANGIIRKFSSNYKIPSSHSVPTNFVVNLVLNPIFAEEENFFEIAEAVFVGWFTFEYVVRFIAAPRKSQ